MTSAWTEPAPVTVRVPAKVNLELLVGPPREDGYHPLATVYQAVGIYDDVTVVTADAWSVSVVGPYAEGVPQDESNLALRGARLLAGENGIEEPVAVTIHKHIPVAGGMAGGSADGAGALVACDALWDLGLNKEELEEIARELGSDVPFLVSGGTAMGSGRGELLAPVLTHGTFHWVFALSDVGLSTPAVYVECDRLRGEPPVGMPVPKPEMMSALRGGDPHALAAVLENDLQEAAFSLRPDLEEVMSGGLGMGALGGVVSGSGPTIAFLVEDKESGIDLAVSLTASGLCPDVRRASGPVHGAHVLPGARVP